jgi:hypothetical protein
VMIQVEAVHRELKVTLAKCDILHDRLKILTVKVPVTRNPRNGRPVRPNSKW